MKTKTRRRRYLLEAGITLLLARAAVRLLPRSWVLDWASRSPRRIHRFAHHQIGWVSWAVETVGGSPVTKSPCLPRALAAHAMLRRRGIVSKLCLGVTGQSDALLASAWVEAGDRVVGVLPHGVRLIASFGGAPA